jgi:diaminohydroxyphosphoribosylaminopyrimidine deaminase / 5-amino-6-(5-phosphoribosylamino)uracil reductase
MSGTANSADDIRFMGLALDLAEHQLGMTAPNPAVGCVIVLPTDAGPRVIARGVTQKGGRPHAETEALARAGAAAEGATAYVSLEPCAHHGKTPPCVDALIAARLARVVVALKDPDARVQGRGVQRLREAGIEVFVGVLAGRAEAVNAGYLKCLHEGRPLVTLKAAASLDGRIATHTGASRWITGERARAAGHLLRARHDAIMIGSATALIDDPELTCRLPGLEDRSPIRIVMDGRLRLPLTAKLVREAGRVPTWVVTRADSETARRRVLEDCGVTVIALAQEMQGPVDVGGALAALGARGLTRLLVEGGAHLAGALLQKGLVDRLAWFGGNALIGADGHPAVAAFGVGDIGDAPRWRRVEGLVFGSDTFDFYEAM